MSHHDLSRALPWPPTTRPVESRLLERPGPPPSALLPSTPSPCAPATSHTDPLSAPSSCDALQASQGLYTLHPSVWSVLPEISV